MKYLSSSFDLENTHQGINSTRINPETIGQLRLKWTYEARGDSNTGGDAEFRLFSGLGSAVHWSCHG